MKKAVFFFAFIIFCQYGFGQGNAKYFELANQAWKLYEAKDYLQSAQTYSKAFNLSGKGLVQDRYNAACSWSLANIKDSSFAELFRITQKGTYNDVDHLTTDSDLFSLHSDKRWAEVVAAAKINKEKAEHSRRNLPTNKN